jgi:SAM-dependent methyltransferase
MFKVITNHPVAIDSDDHNHPEGIFYDNNLDVGFVNSAESYFQNRKISFLDQGCAGGALAIEFHNRGHLSIGIDGSDQALNPSQWLIEEKKRMPNGHENWKKYHDEILFTCDLAKEYTIEHNGELAKFDLITSWDVMEHFNPEDVDQVLASTAKHLKPDGIFVANIALFQSGRHESDYNIDYHKTVRDSQFWHERLEKFFSKIDYPFTATNRRSGPMYLLYAGKKL